MLRQHLRNLFTGQASPVVRGISRIGGNTDASSRLFFAAEICPSLCRLEIHEIVVVDVTDASESDGGAPQVLCQSPFPDSAILVG